MTIDLQRAAKVCTPAELEVLQLEAQGLSQRTIAIKLEISRSAVRARHENAARKIAKENKAA